MTLQDFGYEQALATNAKRDAQLDKYDLTPEERTAAVAIFAEEIAPVGDEWWDALAARLGWRRK